MPKNPTTPVAEDALFSPREIQDMLKNAFTASVNPAWGGQPLSPQRLAYARNYAKTLCERLEAADIVTGHMTYQECVCMLIGTALAIQALHCKGD